MLIEGASGTGKELFARAIHSLSLLDELGDISPAMQVRLLRVLQDGLVEPLGSVKPQKVDVRVVAIRVVQLTLPEPRQRRVDIPLLVRHLVAKLNHLKRHHLIGVSDEVMARLMEYEFPGDVRELSNIVEQAFVLCRGGLIGLCHLPAEVRGTRGATRPPVEGAEACERTPKRESPLSR